jgi:hypothetical protein
MINARHPNFLTKEIAASKKNGEATNTALNYSKLLANSLNFERSPLVKVTCAAID